MHADIMLTLLYTFIQNSCACFEECDAVYIYKLNVLVQCMIMYTGMCTHLSKFMNDIYPNLWMKSSASPVVNVYSSN